MRPISVPSAGQAHLYHPEVLRQACIRRRVTVSDSVARVMAEHAYGPWNWIPLDVAAAAAIDTSARAYEVRP